MLLVLSRIAEAEGIDVPEADVEAEIARARVRYQDPKTVKYFESERGRNFIRSSLRRTRVVEGLVDQWLAAHPEHPAAAAPRGRRAVRDRRTRRPRPPPPSTRPTRLHPGTFHEGHDHDHGGAADEAVAEAPTGGAAGR